MLSFCQPILNNFNSGLHALISIVGYETSINLLSKALDQDIDLLHVKRGLGREQLWDLILKGQLRLRLGRLLCLRLFSLDRLIELYCGQLGFKVGKLFVMIIQPFVALTEPFEN